MSVFFSRNNDSHCIHLVFLFETAVKSACKLKRLSVEINSRQKNVSNQFFLKMQRFSFNTLNQSAEDWKSLLKETAK